MSHSTLDRYYYQHEKRVEAFLRKAKVSPSNRLAVKADRRRKVLIKKQTSAEVAFAKIVGARSFTYSGSSWSSSTNLGLRLWRQYPVPHGRERARVDAQYFADFLVKRLGVQGKSANLVIEIDGKHHRDDARQVEYDKRRDSILVRLGYTILRIPAWYVYNEPKKVWSVVDAALRLMWLEPSWVRRRENLREWAPEALPTVR